MQYIMGLMWYKGRYGWCFWGFLCISKGCFDTQIYEVNFLLISFNEKSATFVHMLRLSTVMFTYWIPKAISLSTSGGNGETFPKARQSPLARVLASSSLPLIPGLCRAAPLDDIFKYAKHVSCEHTSLYLFFFFFALLSPLLLGLRSYHIACKSIAYRHHAC